MILLILILISVLVTVMGTIKVNQCDSYENIWGAMCIFGGIITIILLVVGLVYSIFLLAL